MPRNIQKGTNFKYGIYVDIDGRYVDYKSKLVSEELKEILELYE